MNIVVEPQLRKAALSSPAVFAMGEEQDLVITGLETPDVATLKLAVYSIAGVMVAVCETFTETEGAWTGTLDTRTTAALALFTSERVDGRVPVIAVLADTNRLWASVATEIANNPLCAFPVAPIPSVVYLTADMFAGITLDADATAAERGAVLKAILDRLQA